MLTSFLEGGSVEAKAGAPTVARTTSDRDPHAPAALADRRVAVGEAEARKAGGRVLTRTNGLRSPHETRNAAGVVSTARKTAAEPGGDAGGGAVDGDVG